MTGRLIAVVGPSGVGKDSVLEALVTRDPHLVLARRIITRAADAGGEAFESVNAAEFERLRAGGAFALNWEAHGLRYAIPAEVDQHLAKEHDVLANLSRSVLSKAWTRFARLTVIALTAEPAVLSQRLAARGRESAEQIVCRLEREAPALPDGINVYRIDNSSSLDTTVLAVMACLYPVRA
jgi:ribose 1,5-bisphosphokinase